MIRIDESARDILDEYFSENAQSSIRVYVSTRSQNGPRLALMPDTRGSHDLSFESGGYTFLISERLASQLGDIEIKARHSGFEVIAERPFPQRNHE